MPGATVCEDCTLEGDITIGGGTVIHPRVTIIAEGGPIIIAEYCIIEEYSMIIHKWVIIFMFVNKIHMIR